MTPMQVVRVVSLVLLTATLGACAAKAQVRTEVELPLLEPPPPPPRVVAEYPEPEPLPVTPAVEAATPAKPPARQSRAEQRPEPITAAPEPTEVAARPSPAASLTLTPTPGSEAQTVSAIRGLMGRAARDLSRVNTNALNADGRSQFEMARRFLEQAEEALKIPNIVFAGRLADKAATMAAILVR
jgi:hypothetical protein